MDNIRYNIPKELIEYELYENKKKQELFGEEAIYLVNIKGSEDNINKKILSKPLFIEDLREDYNYEQNKLKKYK